MRAVVQARKEAEASMSTFDRALQRLIERALAPAGGYRVEGRYRRVTYPTARRFDTEAELVDSITGRKA